MGTTTKPHHTFNMRGKRSKQYRKLMQQYGLSYGFRVPYQVLLDAQMIRDADKFKMDLVGGLERTLHGEVKPMITQCSMRHLYAAASEPGVSYLIDKAKTYERRRCGQARGLSRTAEHTGMPGF